MKQTNFIPAARLHVLTPIYDLLCSVIGLGERLRRFETARLPANVNGSVLEVGCGTAQLLERVGRRFPDAWLVGSDVDPQILDLARERVDRAGLRACFVTAAAEELPLASASCDLVLSSLMLHHLPTDAKRAALREWHRVLKPTGELLLFDFGAPRSLAAKVLLWPLYFHILEEQADNFRGLVPGMLAEAGFSAEEVGVYRGVIVAYRARR